MSGFQPGPLLIKSKAFAINIIRFCDLLNKEKHFILSRQLFKSGTSIGANISEAQHAESLADFIHKMRVACKEAGETLYWLDLCKECYPSVLDDGLFEYCLELLRMLNKTISTSVAKLRAIKD